LEKNSNLFSNFSKLFSKLFGNFQRVWKKAWKTMVVSRVSTAADVAFISATTAFEAILSSDAVEYLSVSWTSMDADWNET
jgi:hypothetical protein